MSFEQPYWMSNPTQVKITGKFMTDMDLKLRVGEYPEITFTIWLEALVESLPKKVFEKLHKHMTRMLLEDIHIGVKPIEIRDHEGNLIGEMWSEAI